MSWTGNKLLRLAALWLLSVAVVVGPTGLGGWLALASECGADCPCEAETAEPGEAHASRTHAADAHASEAHAADAHAADAHAADAHEGDHDSCGDESTEGSSDSDCPDDCPDCHCGSGLTLAVFSLPASTRVTLHEATTSIFSEETTTKATASGVFRPPRSLA